MTKEKTDILARAKGSPTKDFFIDMITRDISLLDCIFDLIDNCLDGARRCMGDDGQKDDAFKGFLIEISASENEFAIKDNCGGIDLDNAVNYAFHFGRRHDAPKEGDFAIGLYGIGMKRAIFKIGKEISIHTSTKSDHFSVPINVNAWRDKGPADWDFDLEVAEPIEGTGTIIQISELNTNVAAEFKDMAFVNQLGRAIARDYGFFLKKGLRIKVNDRDIRGNPFLFVESDDFTPLRIEYVDPTGVNVEIIAGATELPSEEDYPDRPKRVADIFGWFVTCNDRVVLPHDKSDKTVWGRYGVPAWHQQFNGFLGIVRFEAQDETGLLPWTTTKRDIDQANEVYRRAITEMKPITKDWINYTNQRKQALESAREMEKRVTTISLAEVKKATELRFPTIVPEPKIEMATVHFLKPKAIVVAAAKTLGNTRMKPSDVGKKVFEYFVKREVDEADV